MDMRPRPENARKRGEGEDEKIKRLEEKAGFDGNPVEPGFF
ncbi:hypothetical protein SDC9_162908 [bioreactor metagenome]|uniref:Uncharacterized protein n=1 Tax=bioreactor metagenome TaxID=1076179 RepID=A0A645FU93_9ZZZZ